MTQQHTHILDFPVQRLTESSAKFLRGTVLPQVDVEIARVKDAAAIYEQELASCHVLLDQLADTRDRYQRMLDSPPVPAPEAQQPPVRAEEPVEQPTQTPQDHTSVMPPVEIGGES
ncbi:hypothetical protein ABT294_00825 [Nonomuraea sp. NPDC000554]|uniref:hypothetical protein n=1 Tax=Nonomuraea sp. NPDC000554 TaxID=3154259 RepID=UPI0033202415